jgi:tetratricopeptide (TPR) repeat protein
MDGLTEDGLNGQHVAVTGHLACMSHGQAAAMIRSLGGVFTSTVNQHTNLLVVGSWPLKADGRLTKKLSAARELQRKGIAITIRAEEDFLAELGQEGGAENAQRLYNLAELALLLKVPHERIRRWLGAGWLKPVKEDHGVQFFDFQQVIGIKTLWRLTRSGVRPARIRRSLEQIRAWINTDNPLSQLALFEETGHLYVTLEDGLADLSGQRYLDFEEEHSAVPLTEPESADDWFHAGRRHEEAEQWDLAVAAYRQSLLIGGSNAATVFNLANVLSAWGKNEAALERYCQAVEMEPGYAKAWNNLGGVLMELDQLDQAISAYRKAIELGHADSHYNLASLLEQIDRPDEARSHWQAYVAYDPGSQWGKLAAERLSETGPTLRQRRNS